MRDKNEVTLLVNGIEYRGWKSVSIAAGIERVARDFDLDVTDRWPGATDIPRRIRAGDVCEVYIGDDKLLTGYVDATPIRYDGKSVSVGVKGRSKTADLVDCAAVYKGGEWRNIKVERIAADLAAPFGIEVVAEAATGAPVIKHSINPGESAFDSIDRLLSLHQLLCTDDAEGRAVFVKAGSGGRCGTALVYGQNILEADAPLDGKGLFSNYTAKGQRIGRDGDSGPAIAHVTGSASDASVKRHRPLIVLPHGNVTTAICTDRACYEKLHRSAKSLETTYTVQGWRQADGTLWLPNKLVRVTDPVIGFDAELLIVEVSWKKSEEGTRTLLRVGPASGYMPMPEAKKQEKDQGWAPGKDVTVIDFPVKK